MNNVIELRRQRAAVLDQADAILSAALGEQRALTDDEQAQVSGLKQRADKINEQATLAEQIEAARASKPVQAPAVNRGPAGDNEGNAWMAFMRYGDRGGLRHLVRDGENGASQIVLTIPSQRETRAVVDSTMNITTAADGKNLVPTTLVNDIAMRKSELMLADRIGCRRIPGVGTTVNYPYQNNGPDPLAETSEQSDAYGNNYERSALTTDLKAYTLRKFTRKVVVTEEMFDDTPIEFMAAIATDIAMAMALTHNAMLVAEVEANGTSFKSFTSNSAIVAGELEAIVGNDTLSNYLESALSASWIMRSSTHWAINSVVGDARFYAQQLAGLLGYGVNYSNKVDAIGAGGKSVLFGDWYYMGYRESPELRFIQDPYSIDGAVALKYSFRAVYGILQAGAIGYGAHP